MATNQTQLTATAANDAPGNGSAKSSVTPVRGNTITTNPQLKRALPSDNAKGGKPPTPGSASTTTSTLQTKKRPYRRTKRPKNYCDKSTVTTVTTPTRQDDQDYDSTNPDGTNVYDAVLAECEDLLRASTEAQRLGRLKMASAYQLLLHTRLVGLGKRFDRSAMMVDQQKARQQVQQQQHAAQAQKQLDLENSLSSSAVGKDETATSSSALEGTESNSKAESTKADGTAKTPNSEGGEIPVTAALDQLRSILPGNLEMDASMMEHLARAAVELHHQRTGRRKSADGLLASPIDGGLAAAAKTMAVAALSSENKNAPSETTSNNKPTMKKSSVAWTPAETGIVIKALTEGKDNYTIASTLLPNKTVQQVHAFVKNQQQLHKVNKQQQQQAGNAITGATTSGSSADASKAQAIPSSVGSASTNAATDKPPLGGAPPPRRGGRGRKPPTTAMNTVPNVSMDVRSLLRNANPKKSPDSAENEAAPSSST